MKAMELKNTLIDDLKVCISYEPHKENDLLCMMEQYLKIEGRRKKLKPEIKKLLDDKPYQNPFAINYPYEDSDIILFEIILSEYTRKVNSAENIRLILLDTIAKINEIHERCGNELIDEWRKPKLEDLLIIVAKQKQLKTADLLVEQYKRW